MKKILTVVYDDILADPRASKFKRALSSFMQVHNLSVRSIEGERGIGDMLYEKKKGGKYIELLRFWLYIIKIYRIKRPDIILAHNYYVAFPCYVLSKFYKTKLVYDAYELYVPEKKQKFSFRYYLFYYLERMAIKNAELVFSANNERSRLMKAVYSLSHLPTPILNMPMNICDNNEKAKTDSFTIVYEGVITYDRHLKLLLETINYLPENYNILYIGNGPDYEDLRTLVSSHPHRDRIQCVGRVLNKEIIPLLSRCKLGFVGYPMEGLNNIYCSPNKIYEYPAAGIPFVSTCHTPIRSITSQYHICEFFNPNKDKAKELAGLIMKIANNYSFYCENIQSFNNDHTWENEAIKIKNAVKSTIE